MTNTAQKNAITDKAREWLDEKFDTETRVEVQKMIDRGGEELTDAFYRDLEFGTGGLRGIMGAGTNRMNKYTVGMATRGFARFLKEKHGEENISVAIAHDPRHNSRFFAECTADVFSANGIEVYLFEDLRPTPELSFAIRHLGCKGGVMITASHNPVEYNGYKVYGDDGAQLVPPEDGQVIEQVRKTSIEDIDFHGKKELIRSIGEEVDEAYLDMVRRQCLHTGGKDKLKVVFTPIHGTAVTLMEKAFRRCGFANFETVEEQATPDGDFPTVESPNPEEGAALQMAVDLAEKNMADLVIGCDPDADRVGIAVRDHHDKLVLLNGNQTATFLIYYLLNAHYDAADLGKNSFIAKTIVTTDVLREIAQHFNVECAECLTGFKWIARLIRQAEGKKRFIAGGEESYGYLVGDAVRDKDAISSAVMIAEAAAWAKSRGSSFFEELMHVYMRFGYYKESLFSITRKGEKGAAEIRGMMDALRERCPQVLCGVKVACVRDYLDGSETKLENGRKTALDFPESNVIQLLLEDGSKITARPSGTEPKIKFYFSLRAELSGDAHSEEVDSVLAQRVESMKSELLDQIS